MPTFCSYCGIPGRLFFSGRGAVPAQTVNGVRDSVGKCVDALGFPVEIRGDGPLLVEGKELDASFFESPDTQTIPCDACGRCLRLGTD